MFFGLFQAFLPGKIMSPAFEGGLMLKTALNYYQQPHLSMDGKAKAYFQSRGIFSVAAIIHHQLGFSNGSFLASFPYDSKTAEGLEWRKAYANLGILTPKNYLDRFNPGIVFPIFGENRDPVQVYGRKTSKRLRSGLYHVYLNQNMDCFWNMEGIQGPEVILCKSPNDALTFWVHGFKNVTCVLGHRELGETQLRLLKEFGVSRVVLALGNTSSLNNLAEGLSSQLKALSIDTFQLTFPRNTDPNDFAQHNHLSGLLNQTNDFPPCVQIPSVALDTPQVALKVQVENEEVFIQIEDRLYRIRGLFKNLSLEQMKVNIRVSRGDDVFVDHIELYASRQRHHFIQQAAMELGMGQDTVKRDLGKLIMELEKLQDALIHDNLESPEMTEDEKNKALDFLMDPNLIQRIQSDLNDSGLVGEENNKLFLYLALLSRNLPKPLAVLIQSLSAAGKSRLLDTIMEYVPPEARLKFSALTSQSMYYMGQKSLKHKVLAIEESMGAERAVYSLKILQSERELTLSSTSSDKNGLSSKPYKVEGPVMIAMTTTGLDIDDELLSRCLVLTVDEGRAQTRAIHEIQRKEQTFEGMLHQKRYRATIELHRNAQRLLRPLHVVNPYAPALTFNDHSARMRRDHIKYLTLIATIAYLHQFQLEHRSAEVAGEWIDYIEVQPEHIELANTLANEAFGRCLDDLPAQTRKLLGLIDAFVSQQAKARKVSRSDVRFSRKELKDACFWSHSALKIHLARLVEAEYLNLTVLNRRYIYECLYESQSTKGEPFVLGLTPIHKLPGRPLTTIGPG